MVCVDHACVCNHLLHSSFAFSFYTCRFFIYILYFFCIYLPLPFAFSQSHSRHTFPLAFTLTFTLSHLYNHTLTFVKSHSLTHSLTHSHSHSHSQSQLTIHTRAFARSYSSLLILPHILTLTNAYTHTRISALTLVHRVTAPLLSPAIIFFVFFCFLLLSLSSLLFLFVLFLHFVLLCFRFCFGLVESDFCLLFIFVLFFVLPFGFCFLC